MRAALSQKVSQVLVSPTIDAVAFNTNLVSIVMSGVVIVSLAPQPRVVMSVQLYLIRSREGPHGDRD